MSQVVSFVGYVPAARYDATPWTNVKVEESVSNVGPWTLIDTIALIPVDADPAHPIVRNVTTVHGSDGTGFWYRLTFVDGTGGVGQPTRPVQNPSVEKQFATAAELAIRLGLEFTDDEIVRADALLASASGLIAEHAKQQIALVTDDTLTMPGTNRDRFRLPERPVVEVASVTIGGQALAEGHDWYLKGDEIIRLSSIYVRNGSLDGFLDAPYLLGRSFGWPGLPLTIVYTHGYDDDAIPSLVKTICMEMAVRVWVNPGSVARETVGNTQTVYDNNRFSPSGLLLTDTERNELRRFFGGRATSVQVA